MIRILQLTERVTRRVLARRKSSGKAAQRVAAGIVGDVRRRGDRALFGWSRRLDGLQLDAATLWIKPEEIRAARREVSTEFLRAVEHAARNIRRVAERQLPRPWSLRVEPGVRVSQRVEPLEVIGCYVPGGRYSLVSTLLMTAIPARVAGVGRVTVACPGPSTALLAAANVLGETEIARVGGAQAIAAMAYGTESFPRVHKIFGPGNRYVTAAKHLVSGDCAIDLLAGPSELLISAARGNARFIAADLLAQAEHDPEALAVFVTTSQRLARAVRAEVARQLKRLPAGNPAAKVLARSGPILLAKSLKDAVQFANRLAPEHLSLPGSEPEALREIGAAGSIFVGPWSAQPLGDYATGSNHVLPTNGVAKVRGGLSTTDFVRCMSVQQVTKAGLRQLGPVAKALAEAEGLPAHRRAIEVRE
ncbi:MAG: histidinol dehydrogenase [Candidatus Acidiferrales bacterium]